MRVELSFDSSWRLQTARLHGQGLLRATWMAENGVLTPQKGEQATTEAFESLQGDVSRALEAKRVSCESLASPAVGQRCGKVRWRLISSGGAKDEIVIDHPK